MREALWILRKDVDQRKWPLCGFLALLFVRMAIDVVLPRHTEFMIAQMALGLVFVLGAIGLIYDAVRQERMVGDTQYWLTRPFPRFSILAAKGMFVGLFVLLPLIVTGILAVALNGLMPAAFPPLAWLMLLTTAFVAAAASVTRNTVQFVLGAIAYLVFSLLANAALVQLFGVDLSWSSAQTVRSAVEVIIFLGTIAASLALQYGHRATALSRTVLIAGILATVIGLPGWRTAFTLLEKQTGAGPGSGVALAFDSARSAEISAGPWMNMTNRNVVGVRIPIRITGVPEGATLTSERVRATIDTARGEHWDSGWRADGGVIENRQAAMRRISGMRMESNRVTGWGNDWVELNIDRDFYDSAKLKDSSARLNTTIAFTALKPRRVAVMPIPATAYHTQTGSLCSSAIPNRINLVITCFSASDDDPLDYTYRLTDGEHSEWIGMGSTIGGLSAWSVASTSIGSLGLGEPRFDIPLRPLFTGPTKLVIDKLETVGYFERSLSIDGIDLGPYEAGRSGPRRKLW